MVRRMDKQGSELLEGSSSSSSGREVIPLRLLSATPQENQEILNKAFTASVVASGVPFNYGDNGGDQASVQAFSK